MAATNRPTAPRIAPCVRTRLAENHIAAVDVCECGMMHLHLGPFSLRLTADALTSLLETLAQATGASVVRSTRPALAPGAAGREGWSDA